MSNEPEQVYEMKPMGEGYELIRAQESAQIDIAVSTARAYPRSIDRFRKNLQAYATASQETAEDCFYSKPVGGGQVAEGPSVRFAELVAATYGNIRVKAYISQEDAKSVTATGEAWDMENNLAASVSVSRSVLKRDGQRVQPSQIEVIKAAAIKTAYRNSIFSIVPPALVKDIQDEIKKVAIGNEKTHAKRIEAMLEYFKKNGVKEKAVLTYIERETVGDITGADLLKLKGIVNAVQDGEYTFTEAFNEARKMEVGKGKISPKPEEPKAEVKDGER